MESTELYRNNPESDETSSYNAYLPYIPLFIVCTAVVVALIVRCFIVPRSSTGPKQTRSSLDTEINTIDDQIITDLPPDYSTVIQLPSS